MASAEQTGGVYGTPFQEAQIILAISADDDDTATEVLDSMSVTELRAFAQQATTAAQMALVVADGKERGRS